MQAKVRKSTVYLPPEFKWVVQDYRMKGGMVIVSVFGAQCLES